LLEAECVVPDGSLTAQENKYGLGKIALLTETVIVTPEEVDSNIRFGEETMLYVSTALAWLETLESVMQTMSTKNGVILRRRICN
jgi:hypothetical protein